MIYEILWVSFLGSTKAGCLIRGWHHHCTENFGAVERVGTSFGKKKGCSSGAGWWVWDGWPKVVLVQTVKGLPKRDPPAVSPADDTGDAWPIMALLDFSWESFRLHEADAPYVRHSTRFLPIIPTCSFFASWPFQPSNLPPLSFFHLKDFAEFCVDRSFSHGRSRKTL